MPNPQIQPGEPYEEEAPNTTTLRRFSESLEYFIKIIEGLVITFWMFLNVILVSFTLYHGSWCSSPFLLLKDITSDWKILAFLCAPFIYRPLRKLIEEIKGFGQMDREKLGSVRQKAETEDADDGSEDYQVTSAIGFTAPSQSPEEE